MGLFGGGNNNIMLQAVGAMMSGQSPQQFMKNLARQSPQLQGMNFDNLEGTARNLANKKGVNVEDAVAQIKSNMPTN